MTINALRFPPAIRRATLRLGCCVAFAAMLAPLRVSAETIFLDPTPYLSQADSPFDLSGLGTTFFLEDFEDGLLNTPGVIADPHATVYGPSSFPFIASDSVDADDGAIDGTGSESRSMRGSLLLISGNVFVDAIQFNFHETARDWLPTHVGLVVTDGADQIRFEAFGRDGEWLGRLVLNEFGDGTSDGGTEEDRFFGVIDSRGISEIRVYSASVGHSSFLEVDHLQYGIAIPEPSGFQLLLCVGFALILPFRFCPRFACRKRRFPCSLGFLVDFVARRLQSETVRGARRDRILYGSSS